MRAVPQPLIRTDTRLDLALDLKHSPSPTTPRAHGQVWLNPPDENTDPKRTLKRTESLGKARALGRGNALAPTVSIWGEDYVKTHELPHRDALKPVSLPVFSQHEDDNVGSIGKWHVDVLWQGRGPLWTPPTCAWSGLPLALLFSV